MNEIKVSVKVERNEWIKFNFIIGYSNPFIIFITFIGIVIVFQAITHLNSIEMDFRLYLSLIFGLYFLVGIPVSTLIQANKNIKNNKWVSQKLNYTFTSTDIIIQGESFDLKMLWSDVKSIKEFKEWYTIYIDKQRGFLIPKNRFESETEELNFREIILGIKGITKKMK